MEEKVRRYVYVDVGNMMSSAFVSGIQRVVREVTKYLIKNQDKWGLHIVLLKWDNKKKAYQLLDNNYYLMWLQGDKPITFCDLGQFLLPEQIEERSIFFDIDSVWPNKPPRYYLFPLLKNKNVKIASMIYDVIPITHPQYFPLGLVEEFLPYLDAELAYADLIFTTAKFVEDSIQQIFQSSLNRLPNFKIILLGSNFIAYDKSNPRICAQAKEIANKNSYLFTVGSIEPRKNHKVILDAFDRYLKDIDINIIFCGRAGWNTEKLINRIHTHPDFGKRIFHLEGENDETVSYLYQEALYTVFPTYIEGFGLPAVESLMAGTPVLLSDIPVMHEVAGEYAQYFDPDNPEELAKLVRNGLSDPQCYQRQKNLISDYKPTSWEECSEQVAKGLFELKGYCKGTDV